MCLKVFSHNRDDHAKNFTYIYDEKKRLWRLSPAYDLTYSNTFYGEHTTSVDGNGKNPGEKELVAVEIKARISRRKCENMITEVKSYVHSMLKEYLK